MIWVIHLWYLVMCSTEIQSSSFPLYHLIFLFLSPLRFCFINYLPPLCLHFHSGTWFTTHLPAWNLSSSNVTLRKLSFKGDSKPLEGRNCVGYVMAPGLSLTPGSLQEFKFIWWMNNQMLSPHPQYSLTQCSEKTQHGSQIQRQLNFSEFYVSFKMAENISVQKVEW